jgi:hypothetical protein
MLPVLLQPLLLSSQVLLVVPDHHCRQLTLINYCWNGQTKGIFILLRACHPAARLRGALHLYLITDISDREGRNSMGAHVGFFYPERPKRFNTSRGLDEVLHFFFSEEKRKR